MQGWRGDVGRGDLRLTEYSGNISLRLQRDAWAGIDVSLPSPGSYRVSVDFAAQGLEGRDGCVLDVSVGGTWQEIGRIEDGQDDAITLVSVAGSIDAPGTKMAVRLRADGNAANDTCWADNLRVIGVAAPRNISVQDVEITPAYLETLTSFPTPVSTAHYAPSSLAETGLAELRGQLSLNLAFASKTSVMTDRFGFETTGDASSLTFPVVKIGLVQSGDRLLPTKRGLVAADHPWWDYIMTPGRVWREPGDEAWMRAALPFALVEKNANCVHNGLLTFGYKSDGSVTRAIWQIGSETCGYFQFDAWGVADIDYQPGLVSGEDEIIARDAQENDARIPIRPISTINETHPEIDASVFGSARDVDPASMTAFGLVAEGIHYVGGCETRYGTYPYCDEMVIPSYSFAKSLFGGLGLMRLEKLYPGAKSARIKDYVPACDRVGTWGDVTFEHALDMSTGHYQSVEPDVDEAAAIDQDFFLVASHAEKIELACGQYERRTSPGKTWVYHTSDTYLLGTAMQAFLRARQGDEADIYRDLLVDPIWKPLGLSATLDQTRRTLDETAQPFAGWGLFMQRGDLARLLQFVGTEGGQINGEDMFAPELLKAALQKALDDPGLSAAAPPLGYNNGFWSFDVGEYGKCGRSIPVPFMSGFGGLVAVIIPNDTSYYYISDGGAYAWAGAALATEAISPFCKRPLP
ncbi:MAG: hypothetical protein Hens3KO_09050 [Henriciella sp.]